MLLSYSPLMRITMQAARLALLSFFILTPLVALQKVTILPIINIDKDANFAYLEATITDSLKERLREKFAFDELPERKWSMVAADNFILRDDFYTRSAAMNLGILTQQDIVIGGGFRPVNKKQGEAKNKTFIHTTVFLLDAKNKKTITLFEIDIPADSELFTAVGKVADKMESEARKIIPTKEEVTRKGVSVSSAPFFADGSLGLAIGGGIYAAGYAQYFTPQLPVLSALGRVHTPKLSENLVLFLGFTFINHTLKEGNASAIQTLGASVVTSNYLFSAGLGYQIKISLPFYLEPFVGFGYVLQSSVVTGSGLQSNVSNGFLLARAGVSGIYRVNSFIDAALAAESFAYIENGVTTFVPILSLGVHYKF